MAFISSGAVGADISTTSTTAKFALGTTLQGTDASEWIYVLASEALTVYSALAVTRAYAASMLTNTNAVTDNFFATNQVAFANADYGWVAKRVAPCTLRVGASCAKNVALYSTATAGVLDDTATSIAFRIDGVQILTTNSGGGAASVSGIVVYPNIIVPA